MKLKYILLLAISIPGCSTTPAPEERLSYAKKLAFEAGFEAATFGHQFPLQAFYALSRVSEDAVRIYIEGDGFAYVTSSIPSPDPTPIDPTALKLAVADRSGNVVYLARPCQFNAKEVKQCSQKYWTDERYSEDAVAIVSEAIDDLKKRYGVKEIELVGFSGGATIAAVLAAKRGDVTALRTVAGNLDIDAFVEHHKISEMPHSLNPADFSSSLKGLPQVHIVGERDRIVPSSVVESFLAHQTVNSGIRKARLFLVNDLSHFGDWQKHWPRLLEVPIK